MDRGNRFSILGLLALTTIVAMLIVFPAQVISLFFASASLVVLGLMIATIQDLRRSTDRGDRRLIVPLLAIGIVMIGSFLLSISFFFAAF